MSWAGFWGLFLLVSLAIYTVTALVVGVGAFFDVRRLFAAGRDRRSADRSD